MADTPKPPSPEEVTALLDLELDESAGGGTVRAYLVRLLTELWRDPGDFSGKRPFGSSGWQSDVYLPMVTAGLIPGALDDDGYVERLDEAAADALVLSAIGSLGEMPAPASAGTQAQEMPDAELDRIMSDVNAELLAHVRASAVPDGEALAEILEAYHRRGPRYSAQQIAPVCHEANRALQALFGEESASAPWDAESPEAAEAVAGVEFALRGGTAREQHADWVRRKLAAGWSYGPVKDEAARTHPCIVTYAELPVEQRVKDSVFAAIVRAMAGPVIRPGDSPTWESLAESLRRERDFLLEELEVLRRDLRCSGLAEAGKASTGGGQ